MKLAMVAVAVAVVAATVAVAAVLAAAVLVVDRCWMAMLLWSALGVGSGC